MPTTSESIAAYVSAQSAINDQQDAAIDAIAADVKFLTDKLTEIQNSPGTLSAADQASLDAAITRGNSVLSRLTALDALTNPTPPPVP